MVIMVCICLYEIMSVISVVLAAKVDRHGMTGVLAQGCIFTPGDYLITLPFARVVSSTVDTII